MNPFLDEVYAIKYWNKKDKKYQLNIITSYEVYLSKASASGLSDGHEVECYKMKDIETGLYELYATATIYRKDRSRPTKATVKLSEYSTGKNLWLSKPEPMLKKVALSHGYRQAYPEFMKGIPYTHAEMSEVIDRSEESIKLKNQEIERYKHKRQCTIKHMKL